MSIVLEIRGLTIEVAEIEIDSGSTGDLDSKYLNLYHEKMLRRVWVSS